MTKVERTILSPKISKMIKEKKIYWQELKEQIY